MGQGLEEAVGSGSYSELGFRPPRSSGTAQPWLHPSRNRQPGLQSTQLAGHQAAESGTAVQLRRLLAFETSMQVDAFLKEHEIFDFSAADFEQDRETFLGLRMREARL